MSMRREHLDSPRPVAALENQQSIICWPVVVAAGGLALGFVVLCLAGAWALGRSSGTAKGPDLPDYGKLASLREATDSSEGPVAKLEVRPQPKADSMRPRPSAQAVADSKSAERRKQLSPPALTSDALPGQAVGTKRQAASREAAVGDPGLVQIDDAVAAEKPSGTYGTEISFLDSPADAAQRAQKERKLLFVLHISGNFEDAKFT